MAKKLHYLVDKKPDNSLVDKILYILKVLRSCTTVEQVENVSKWGIDTLLRMFPYKSNKYSVMEARELKRIFDGANNLLQRHIKVKLHTIQKKQNHVDTEN